MDINNFTRRQTLLLAGSSLLLPFAGVAEARALPASDLKSLAALERKVGGRLGVAVLETGSGQLVGHRLNERFGMCSTFKMPLAAAILREVDQGRLRPDQWVPYGPADTVPHAPITQKHLKRGGMTLVALAEAAQTTSDNVAANLLLKLIDGPAGFTSILRSAGDTITRLDRFEPHMNHVRGQDARRRGGRHHRHRRARLRNLPPPRHHNPRRHGTHHTAAADQRLALQHVAGDADWLDGRHHHRRVADTGGSAQQLARG